MTKFPAAERIALDLPLKADDTVDTALIRWRAEFIERAPMEPSDGMAAAARVVLELRVPPPSAVCARGGAPGLIRGV